LPISMPITAIAVLGVWDMACSLSLVPLAQLRLLAGQEHGRTIPLADTPDALRTFPAERALAIRGKPMFKLHRQTHRTFASPMAWRSVAKDSILRHRRAEAGLAAELRRTGNNNVRHVSAACHRRRICLLP
jgi:hypothetical protein